MGDTSFTLWLPTNEILDTIVLEAYSEPVYLKTGGTVPNQDVTRVMN